METDKLYALHEVALTQEDRELLADLRTLLKQFIDVEREILELTRLSMLMAAEGAEEIG